MTEPVFNLVDEPWIRVLRSDGTEEEVSLRDALLRAHTFVDLGGELQTQNIAVLRLLLAVLHTVFSRTDETGASVPLEEPDDAVERWESLWLRGELPEQPIAQYLKQWHERFWLFHPERPFGQSQTAQQGTQCSASKLIGELSESGNKLRLFASRTGEGKAHVTYAEAARWLIYLNGFDDAALKPHIPKEKREGKIAPAWLGQLGLVYAKGNNLFETLLLNLVLLRPDHTLWGENRPAWERETPRGEELRVIPLPDNLAELLTLQSRLIWLNREEEVVTGYGILCGDSFDPQNTFAEQMTAWKKIEKKNEPVYYVPWPHEPGKQMWRDFANIFMTSENAASSNQAPGVVQWIVWLKRKRYLQKKKYVQFATACNRYDSSQKSAVTDVLGDTLTMQAALLDALGVPWQKRIATEVEKCDAIAQEVGLLAWRIFIADGGDSKNSEKDNAVRLVAYEKWYDRIDEPFRRWLHSIDPEKDAVDGDKLTEWIMTARRLALHLGQEYMEHAGTNALFGRRITEKTKKRLYAAPRAYSWFRKRAYEIYQGSDEK
ncbi:MAG: type I-E CRISPR-associated protein Cse1/CasA [Butyricicoccus sp.]|nr:type I-E CRISPR-associated protein Cse1/CasA [Butyricicoccus sp.]